MLQKMILNAHDTQGNFKSLGTMQLLELNSTHSQAKRGRGLAIRSSFQQKNFTFGKLTYCDILVTCMHVFKFTVRAATLNTTYIY